MNDEVEAALAETDPHAPMRGRGAAVQWLHRDEAVWSDVPRGSIELQLASVIAYGMTLAEAIRWSNDAIASVLAP